MQRDETEKKERPKGDARELSLSHTLILDPIWRRLKELDHDYYRAAGRKSSFIYHMDSMHRRNSEEVQAQHQQRLQDSQPHQLEGCKITTSMGVHGVPPMHALFMDEEEEALDYQRSAGDAIASQILRWGAQRTV